MGMSKGTRAFSAIPPATQAALDKLGADPRGAAKAKGVAAELGSRVRVPVATLRRLEVGDPSVSIGKVQTSGVLPADGPYSCCGPRLRLHGSEPRRQE